MRRAVRTAGLAALACLALAAVAQAWGVEYAHGPDPATKRWPAWPFSTSCQETSFDPVATFSGPTEAEQGPGAPEAALREYLATGLHAGLPRDNWRALSITDREALFATGRLELGVITLRFINVGGIWSEAGSPGECMARTASPGSESVPWRLERSQRPAAKSRALQVLTTVTGCPPPAAGALRRDVRQVGRDLVLTVWKPLPTGPTPKCLRRATYQLRVRIPGKLGKRRLWDGSTYPPRRVG